MCGIVGYVGKKRVVPVIIEGLRRLEYRGYDSAGIAVAGNGEGLQIRRAEGKLRNLEEVIRLKPLDGTYGIGHTRWATHGRPTEENAHPHRDCTGKIVVVHNGIVENYMSLKKQAARRRPQVHHRDRYRSDRSPGRAEHETRRTDKILAGRSGPQDCKATDWRFRAGRHLGRRAQQDRSRAQWPARRHRPGQGRILRGLRHTGDPLPHSRSVLPRRRRPCCDHAGRRDSLPTSTASPSCARSST